MDDRVPAGAAYRVVEGLHLRQWAMRMVTPIAALTTNGAGLWSVDFLPRHDAPGLLASVETSLRFAGAGLVVLAAGLRIAAKGVLVRKTTLTTGGAYAVVRHPFYLANLGGALGVFLLAGSLGSVVGAIWLAAAAPLYVITVRGEETALARIFPDSFPAYASAVRAFLPRFPRTPSPAARITWTNLVLENEPPRLLRYLAGATAVCALGLSPDAGRAALAAAALLYGASFVVRALR